MTQESLFTEVVPAAYAVQPKDHVSRAAQFACCALSLLALSCSSEPQSSESPSTNETPLQSTEATALSADSLAALNTARTLLGAYIAADYIASIDTTKSVLIFKAGASLSQIAAGDMELMAMALARLARDVVGTYNIVMCDGGGRVVNAYRTDEPSGGSSAAPMAEDRQMLNDAQTRGLIGSIDTQSDPVVLYVGSAVMKRAGNELKSVVMAAGRQGASSGGSGDVVLVEDKSYRYLGALNAGTLEIAR